MSVDHRFENAGSPPGKRFVPEQRSSERGIGVEQVDWCVKRIAATGKILSNAAQYIGGHIFGGQCDSQYKLCPHLDALPRGMHIVEVTTYRNLHKNTRRVLQLWQHLGCIWDQRNLCIVDKGYMANVEDIFDVDFISTQICFKYVAFRNY